MMMMIMIIIIIIITPDLILDLVESFAIELKVEFILDNF
jgi:hypothetical protein